MDSPKSTQELLDKYWAAETTPEEETRLGASFSADDQGVTAAYFRFLAQERAITAPASRIQQQVQVRRLRVKRMLSMAAAIATIVVAGLVLQQYLAPATQVTTAEITVSDTYDDPMQAYAEARDALLLISGKLNATRERAGSHLAKTQPYLDIMK